MKIADKISKHGFKYSFVIAYHIICKNFHMKYFRFINRKAQQFLNSSNEQLAQIETSLQIMDIYVHPYSPEIDDFINFSNESWFPVDYHGGNDSSVWNEKLLEHWIASERLGLMHYSPTDIYVDIAAGSSPWAMELRRRKQIEAYAIDLSINKIFFSLPYYRIENATQTSFENNSVSGASLHCAYEMFMGDDDTNFIKEAARILKPGGKLVIVPLYMHTEYCTFASPEYFGMGYSPAEANEYIRMDMAGIPSARFYDPKMLKQRVLNPIQEFGLRWKLLRLANKSDYGPGIYCHFILEIEK